MSGETFEDLPVGSCYRAGRTRGARKKVAGDRYATVSKGKLRRRKERSDRKVSSQPCTLALLGIGPKGTSREILELGRKQRRKKQC